MKKKDGTYCPLIKKDCIEFKCKFFQKIIGTNPQTGEYVDEYECAILLSNILLIENSQQQRSTGAAVESFRNEMVKSNDTSLQLLSSQIGGDK